MRFFYVKFALLNTVHFICSVNNKSGVQWELLKEKNGKKRKCDSGY